MADLTTATASHTRTVASRQFDLLVKASKVASDDQRLRTELERIHECRRLLAALSLLQCVWLLRLKPWIHEYAVETSHTSPAGLQGIFTYWELRSFVLLSMVMQIVLTLWTYQRKGISSQPVYRIFWLTLFLAADFSATVCLGGIFHLNMKPNASDRYLISLWSPFILQHLGRHISITTFSLEENEFWLSHLMRLIYHELTAIFICVLASAERQFRGTTVVLFMIGTSKLGERVWALKRGSMSEVKSSIIKKTDPGLSKKEIEPYITANRKGKFRLPIPDQIQHPSIASVHADVRSLCAAYLSFNKCKGIYSDSIDILENADDQGCETLDDRTADKMVRMMEMELGFAYDFFYTKSVFSHTLGGWIARFINIILVICAHILFSRVDKHGFMRPDVWITYILLSLTLFLEVVIFVESSLSNCTLAQVGFRAGRMWRVIEGSILNSRNFLQRTCNCRIFQGKPALMGRFNLLSFCFKEQKSRSFIKSLLNFFELTELHKNYRYTTYIPIYNDDEFKKDVFNGARDRLKTDRTDHPDTLDNIIPLSSRVRELVPQGYDNGGFEECLLVWHIATDICLRTTKHPTHHLLNAKDLSEYMLYLLVVHPSMLSSSTSSELKSYQKAYAAATQLYDDYRLEYDGDEVCMALAKMEKMVRGLPLQAIKGRNSLLVNAQRLATRLKEGARRDRNRDDPNKWKLLFDVWVDLLCYAAIKCRGKNHAEQLGSGGEFITYVWLFITHSCMGSPYQPYP